MLTEFSVIIIFAVSTNAKSLRCTPKTNTMLYINYINKKGFISIINLFGPLLSYLGYSDMAKSKISTGKILLCRFTVLNIQVLKFYLNIKYCSFF